MKGKVNKTYDFTFSEKEVRALEIALRDTVARANNGKMSSDYVEQMEELHKELVSYMISSGDTYNKGTGGVRESESSDDSSTGKPLLDKDELIQNIRVMIYNGDVSLQLGQEVIDDIINDRFYTQEEIKKEFGIK